MSLIKYQDLLTDPAQIRDAQRFMGSRTFFQILKDSDVPRDPDADKNPHYLRQSFNRTDANDMAIAKFAYLASRMPIVLLSDLDGTGARFTERVEDSKLTPGYLEALTRINSTHLHGNHPYDHNQVYAVTGRTEKDARVLLDDQYNRLQIPLIHSHGVGFVTPNGEREEITMSEEEDDFLLTTLTYALTKKNDPDLQVQTKSNGIDIKDLNGSKIEVIRDEINQLMKYCPQRNGTNSFGVHHEGPAETSIRFDVADKARAIQHFIISKADPEAGALFIYAGDSFGKGGTDLNAASFIQSIGGVAIRVQNDRPGCAPDPHGDFQPDITLPNPEALCTLLTSIADTKEALAKSRQPQQASSLNLQRV